MRETNDDRRRHANENRIKARPAKNPDIECARKSLRMLITKVARCHSSRLFRLFIAIVWRTGSGTMAYANGTKSRRGGPGQVSPGVARYIALVTSFASRGWSDKETDRAREEGRRGRVRRARAEHKTTARRGYSPIDPKKKQKNIKRVSRAVLGNRTRAANERVSSVRRDELSREKGPARKYKTNERAGSRWRRQ